MIEISKIIEENPAMNMVYKERPGINFLCLMIKNKKEKDSADAIMKYHKGLILTRKLKTGFSKDLSCVLHRTVL